MNAIAKTQQMQPAEGDNAMLSMVERAARDPNVDIDKLERLVLMQERALAREAKAAYDAAMAELQPELPSIGERGKAMVQGSVRYTFSLWEDINAAIKPILSKHGFALTFRTNFAENITVIGVLSHRAGHREETSITLPADASGNKNAVQAVASSVSYGKRYTAGALLNLTSHGEDDDAFAAGEPNQAADWYAAIEAAATHDDLKRIADEIKTAGLNARSLRNVRAAWSKRSKELA